MNLLEALLDSAKGGALQQAAQSRGIPADAVPAVLKQLIPALSGGLQKNLAGSGGVESLQKALAGGSHARFLDDAAALEGEAAVAEGNGILGHILGSKDVSRAVAGRAAAQTGVDIGAVKQFLPMVAAAAMGAMSKQTSGGASLAGPAGASGLASMLGGMLDSDGDGSVVDDLLSIGKGLFKQR